MYIFCASAIPALAFGEQLYSETGGMLSAVHGAPAPPAAHLARPEPRGWAACAASPAPRLHPAPPHPPAVLAATALTGVVQALAGGQPLLIVGVAEPIVLVYSFLHQFAEKQEGLGPTRFLAFAGWACVWAAAMITTLALTNACGYIRAFTRFSGELFGALIAVRRAGWMGR